MLPGLRLFFLRILNKKATIRRISPREIRIVTDEFAEIIFRSKRNILITANTIKPRDTLRRNIEYLILENTRRDTATRKRIME